MARQLIVPERYGLANKIQRNVDDQLKTRLYRFFLAKTPFNEVRNWFRTKGLRVPESGELEAVWDKFKELEQTKPIKMLEFRRKMGIAK